MSDDRKQLHPDMPLDEVWVVGRRIYVRTPKESRLNAGLIALKGTWDWDLRARWVGTGKRAAMLELVEAELERRREQERASAALLTSGHYVQLPRDVDGVVTGMHRALLALQGTGRELTPAWDGEHWRYALPTAEQRERMQDLLDTWLQRRQAEQARTVAEREQRAQQAFERKRQREARAAAAEAERLRNLAQQVATKAGRVPTGVIDAVIEHDTRYMRRDAAEQLVRPAGQVVRLPDGTRGVVMEADVRFYSEEQASERSYEVSLPDHAHWSYRYRVAVVESTEEEVQAEHALAERWQAATSARQAERAAQVLAPLAQARARQGEPGRAQARRDAIAALCRAVTEEADKATRLSLIGGRAPEAAQEWARFEFGMQCFWKRWDWLGLELSDILDVPPDRVATLIAERTEAMWARLSALGEQAARRLSSDEASTLANAAKWFAA